MARVVFFIAQTQLFQTVPQSGGANGNVQLLQTPSLEFVQGQIRLRRNPPGAGFDHAFPGGSVITGQSVWAGTGPSHGAASKNAPRSYD